MLQYHTLAGVKVAPFEDPQQEPYGMFANTTLAGRYAIKQKLKIHGEEYEFDWPSAEHAYHGQKIIYLKQTLAKDDPRQSALTETLKKLETTTSHPVDYSCIISELSNDLPQLEQSKNIQFMREVISLKCQQHPDFLGHVKACARNGILPINVDSRDKMWGSGNDGRGRNLLGITILEQGNKLLKEEDGVSPAISNPAKAYQDLQGKADLSYASLQDKLVEIPNQPAREPDNPSQRSTHSIPSGGLVSSSRSMTSTAANGIALAAGAGCVLKNLEKIALPHLKRHDVGSGVTEFKDAGGKCVVTMSPTSIRANVAHPNKNLVVDSFVSSLEQTMKSNDDVRAFNLNCKDERMLLAASKLCLQKNIPFKISDTDQQQRILDQLSTAEKEQYGQFAQLDEIQSNITSSPQGGLI